MFEGETVDLWGMRYQAIKYETGVYNEQYHWPLAAAKTIDALERYAWPSRPFDFAQGAVSLVEPRGLVRLLGDARRGPRRSREEGGPMWIYGAVLFAQQASRAAARKPCARPGGIVDGPA